MAGRNHGDSGGEIEESIAVDIVDHGAVPAGDYQWIGARIGRRQDCGVARDKRPRLIAGQIGDQIGQIRTDGFQSFHNGSFG